MITKRCINDSCFKYCSGEPRFTEEAAMQKETGGQLVSYGGSCKSNPETCGKSLTLTQVMAEK